MYDPKGLFVILKKSSVLKLKYESEKRKALFMLSFDSKFSKRKVLERAEFLKSIIARKQIPLYNNLTNYSGLAMGFLANSERIKTTRQLQFSSLPESLVKQLNEMILRLINSLRIDLVRITKLGPQIIIYLKKEQELLEEIQQEVSKIDQERLDSIKCGLVFNRCEDIRGYGLDSFGDRILGIKN